MHSDLEYIVREEDRLQRDRQKQYQYFDKSFTPYFNPCRTDRFCPKKTTSCQKFISCGLCGISRNPCSCDKCEKSKYPCAHKKFPCTCKLCQRLPDSKAIPESLPLFKRLDLSNIYHNPEGPHYRISAETATFQTNILRREICGSSAIATHFAQERFSAEHLKKLGVDTRLAPEFDSLGFLPNFEGNLKAWKEHKKVKKAINNFKKRYHRNPPCFRERMDIKSLTKVSSCKKLPVSTFYAFFIFR
jgi:hypothetical protein